jgi:hypothetical protein
MKWAFSEWFQKGMIALLIMGAPAPPAHACWVAVSLDQLVTAADLVVVGRITRTNGRITLGEGEARRRYVLATITVREVLKGSRVRFVRLAYPSGEPVDGSGLMWSVSTDISYHAGQDGIWILTKDQEQDFFWADYPDDYQKLTARPAVVKALTPAKRPPEDSLLRNSAAEPTGSVESSPGKAP